MAFVPWDLCATPLLAAQRANDRKFPMSALAHIYDPYVMFFFNTDWHVGSPFRTLLSSELRCETRSLSTKMFSAHVGRNVEWLRDMY